MTKGRIYIPNQNMPRICPDLAAEIGLNESILLLQLDYWISVAGKEREGKQWVYESLSDIQESLSFWSRGTINRIVHSLQEKKLIFIGNFNRRKGDKTRWFSLNYETINELESVVVNGKDLSQNETPVSERDKLSQNGTALSQNETTLPDLPHVSTDKTQTPVGDLEAELFSERTPQATPPPGDGHSVTEHHDPFSLNAHCEEKRKKLGAAPDWAMLGAEGVHPFYQVVAAFCKMTHQDLSLFKPKKGKAWLSKYEMIARDEGLTPSVMLKAHEFLPDKDRGAWYIQRHKWLTPFKDGYVEQLVDIAQHVRTGALVRGSALVIRND